MIHPNVLKNTGHDSDALKGFAFGVGIERLAQIYYGIEDMRVLYGSDLDFFMGCS